MAKLDEFAMLLVGRQVKTMPRMRGRQVKGMGFTKSLVLSLYTETPETGFFVRWFKVKVRRTT